MRENSLTFRWVLDSLKTSRFAFVVSRKVSKKAVLRNKIRRRLREAVRSELPFLKKGIDGIIIINPGAEKRKQEEINKDLNEIFTKTKLRKRK